MKRKQLFNFSKILLKWDKEHNDRQMPWKGETDPYKIWLSEIILQQTRVEQGLKYYQNFITVFPDIHKLAKAPDQQVYKLWEGLGYYTRCRNLIATARYVSMELKGKFPGNYEELKKLKGVGPYTAAAIASFAFNEPRAVIDGNVFRVLARIFGINKPIDTAEGKKYFNLLANELLDKEQPALHNQGIMDFGAVVCKPLPLCEQCSFNKYCRAFLCNKVFSYPVNLKKTVIKKRWFNYVILEYKGRFVIRQRTGKDIWHNLFEFLLVESIGKSDKKKLLKEAEKAGWLQKNSFKVINTSPIFRQQLSHQFIQGQFIRVKLNRKPGTITGIVWVTISEVKNYPFPKFINQYLEKFGI